MARLWIGFVVFVVFLLWLDLGVLHRRAQVLGTRAALGWTLVWVTLALGFSGVVYTIYGERGTEAAKLYLAGYLVEQSLSLDNVFVMALVFAYFRVPADLQHRTLFYGILGAMVLRGLMIAGGVALLHRFEWLTYVFGTILVATAVRMTGSTHEQIDPDRSWLVRLARRVYPITSEFDGERFAVRLPDGRLALTPLFLALLVIEATDVVFAVDSIPAIFGLTREPFIVFTSNVFAILGLRSLYFILAHALRVFAHVKTSLVLVLAFIGLKMLLAGVVQISTDVSLLVVALLLGGGVLASLARRRPSGGQAAEQLTLPGLDEPNSTPPRPAGGRGGGEVVEVRASEQLTGRRSGRRRRRRSKP